MKTAIELLFKGEEKLAEWHIENDCADVNYKHVFGDSAMTAAALNGYYKIVKLLLSKGANIHIRNLNYSTTPLLEAASRGHVDVIELLFENGACMKDKDIYGMNALITAAKGGYLIVVQLLIKRGASPNYKIDEVRPMYNGFTAIIMAAWKGHFEIVEYLLSFNPDLNDETERCETALILASTMGHVDIVKLLLVKGADPNIQSITGNTALMSACRKGHVEIAEMLMAGGANVNDKNKMGKTSLMMASSEEIVERLLSNGAITFVDEEDSEDVQMYERYYGDNCEMTSDDDILQEKEKI